MDWRIDPNILFWGLGIIQPATSNHINRFFSSVFPDLPEAPPVGAINEFLESSARRGLVSKISTNENHYYSLTYKGNTKIPRKLRYHRDKSRLFLLKTARFDRKIFSGGRGRDLVGDTPTVKVSRGTQELQRPIMPAVAHSGRHYWPLLVEQLFAGPKHSPPDVLLDCYSFPTWDFLRTVCIIPKRRKDPPLHYLASAIGVSSRLISSFLHVKDKHYRSFTIGKRGGGERVIDSPRLFLKTIQYWIIDYILFFLIVHPSCHSYQTGKSIISNASVHKGKKFVANIDIENFFGSISEKKVVELLCKHGLEQDMSRLVASIVTLRNGLPQGAPTSPIISNSYLYDFDQMGCDIAERKNLSYTRYADDITVSGNDRKEINLCLNQLRKLLRRFDLKLNDRKTRVASQSGQQKVTGVVVNRNVSPPRRFRRKIRAMFHNADVKPERYKGCISELRGYLGYLESFPYLKDLGETEEYIRIVKKVLKVV